MLKERDFANVMRASCLVLLVMDSKPLSMSPMKSDKKSILIVR